MYGIVGDGMWPNLPRVQTSLRLLGPPALPCCSFLGQGSPSKIDHRNKKGYHSSNLSLLEDLVVQTFVYQACLWASRETKLVGFLWFLIERHRQSPFYVNSVAQSESTI